MTYMLRIPYVALQIDGVQTYTTLADRTAALEKRAKTNDSSAPESPLQSPKGASGQSARHGISDTEALTRTRTDLSEAQRSRGIIQSELQNVSSELQQLKLQSAVDTKRLHELASDKASLALKLKDRDEELKGKAKLLEDVHDETVSLTLQLNMAEDQARKLRKENEDLVARWMARMGKEADAMNEASKFH
ncbi:MAG: hypothetical protein L6R39_002076 [Caloplaca ligustica]|nr:MAG: hypothetical protein L6R39_002076 [Caloplaca ligustica]